MQRATQTFTPDSPAAAAQIIAAMLARDGHVDWRELEFVERIDACHLIGLRPAEFPRILATAVAERTRAGAGLRSVEAAVGAIRLRRIQILLAAMLVYIAEIDRDIGSDESGLVRFAFERWGVTPGDLLREMGVPLRLSQSVVGGLRDAA